MYQFVYMQIQINQQEPMFHNKLKESPSNGNSYMKNFLRLSTSGNQYI